MRGFKSSFVIFDRRTFFVVLEFWESAVEYYGNRPYVIESDLNAQSKINKIILEMKKSGSKYNMLTSEFVNE